MHIDLAIIFVGFITSQIENNVKYYLRHYTSLGTHSQVFFTDIYKHNTVTLIYN